MKNEAKKFYNIENKVDFKKTVCLVILLNFSLQMLIGKFHQFTH